MVFAAAGFEKGVRKAPHLVTSSQAGVQKTFFTAHGQTSSALKHSYSLGLSLLAPLPTFPHVAFRKLSAIYTGRVWADARPPFFSSLLTGLRSQRIRIDLDHCEPGSAASS
jgi:hypothetical protein